MAGEQHGGAKALVVIRQEGAHPGLGIDIKAEGGFVQKQHLGAVQQGRQQFGLHALAQRQLAQGPLEFCSQIEHLG